MIHILFSILPIAFVALFISLVMNTVNTLSLAI
jgi:hypothetical protein